MQKCGTIELCGQVTYYGLKKWEGGQAYVLRIKTLDNQYPNVFEMTQRKKLDKPIECLKVGANVDCVCALGGKEYKERIYLHLTLLSAKLQSESQETERVQNSETGKTDSSEKNEGMPF